MANANSTGYFIDPYSLPSDTQSTFYNYEYPTNTAPRPSNQLNAVLYDQSPILPNENDNYYLMNGEYTTGNPHIHPDIHDRNEFAQAPDQQHIDAYVDPGGHQPSVNPFSHVDMTPTNSPTQMLTQQMHKLQFGSPHVPSPSYSLMQQGYIPGANSNANMGVFTTPNVMSPLGTPLSALDPALIYNPTQDFHQSDNVLSASLFRVDTKREHYFKGIGDRESLKGKVADKIIKIMDEVEVPLDEQAPPWNLEKQTLILNEFVSKQDHDIRLWLECVRTEVGTQAGKRIAREKRRKGATTRLHYCIWCHNTLTSKNNLANHVRSHLQLHLSSCPKCGLSTVNRRLPTRHKCTKKGEPSTNRQPAPVPMSYPKFHSPQTGYWQGPPFHQTQK